MDKLRLATRSLSVGLGAFRRPAVAPRATRYYSTRAEVGSGTGGDISNLSKRVILYGGSALAVEGIKYLIDYGGNKFEEAECRKIMKQIDEECKLYDELREKFYKRKEALAPKK